MLDNAPRARYTLIHCALDDVIPFCEWFVLPYCSWFLLLAAALLFLWRTDTTSYRRLCLAMFSGMTFCLLLYMAWPTALSLRPEVLPRDNFASALLRLLWAADTPTNVCPSIHCQSSAVIGLVMWHSAPASRRRALRWASVLWPALICASTVFVKQHSAVDVAWGVALALPWYLWFYRRPRRLRA